MTLWTPMGLPFGDVDLTSTSNFTVTVFTNREDARFVVIDKASQEVLGAGSGKEAKITFPPDSSSTVVANVKYLNIITTNEKQNAVTLIAPIGPDFDIMPNTAGAHTDYGDYRVK
jgi:hypothetical protein